MIYGFEKTQRQGNSDKLSTGLQKAINKVFGLIKKNSLTEESLHETIFGKKNGNKKKDK